MNWIELTGTEYDQAWDLFYNRFSFSPSIKSDDWPSITIDDEYITYSLTSTWDDTQELEEKCSNVFKSLVCKEEYIYALDWQHECFWFNPNLPKGDREWIIPFYPDGDYYIFFPKDLRWCYFSHPWERSVTLISKDLIQAFNKNMPIIFGDVLRRS